MIRIAFSLVLSVLVFVTSGKASAASSPNPTYATPDTVSMLVERVEILPNDLILPVCQPPNCFTIFENSTNPVDVMDLTNRPIQKDQIPVGSYKVIHLTVRSISWTATWNQSTNPSPCKNDPSVGGSGLVDLGGHKDFWFKTPDLGGNTLAYYLANPPVSPAAYVGDPAHPFVLASPIQVTPDNGGKTPTTVNLVIGVANTLTCDSIKMFHTTDDPTAVQPLDQLTGAATRLTDSDGVYFDSVNNEIFIANRGNNSITVYDRAMLGNSPPKQVDNGPPDQRRILIGPATRLNKPAGLAVYHYIDPTTGTPDPDKDELMVANLGNDSVTIYSRTAIGNVPPKRTIVGMQTGLSRPAGVAVYRDPTSTPTVDRDEIFVANSGNDSITVYSRLSSENAAPVGTIKGANTQLSSPCGLILDPSSSSFIVVANSGTNSVTHYNRTLFGDVTGTVLTNTNTNWVDNSFQIPCGISYWYYPPPSSIQFIYVSSKGNFIDDLGDADSTNDEIGVLGSGPQAVMAFSPAVFPSSANALASTSNLSGEYNVVIYGADLPGVNGHGILNPVLFAEKGTVSFDPSTSPLPSFTLRRDSQIRRQIMEPDCPQENNLGNAIVGIYGVNDDGSFYAYLPNMGGTLRGAFVPDGSMMVGTMVDSSNRLQVVYGVKNFKSTKITKLTADGTPTGPAATYAFTNYRNDVFTINRFTNPPSDDLLRYRVAIGMAQTDAQEFLGSSGDANSVTVLNPAGDFAPPSSGSVSYTEDSEPSLTQAYQVSPFTASGGGDVEGPQRIGLSGYVDENGTALLFIRNTTTTDGYTCPTDFGFGMGLRQKPSGTFHTGSLKGMYFVAGFGDRFNSIAKLSSHRSTAAAVNFDGNGKATVNFIYDEMGRLSADQFSFTYRVNSRFVPATAGSDGRMAVDVVDLYDNVSPDPYASALIGNDGQSLAFFKGLNPGGTPNPERLLGLGLFQHP